MKFHKKNIGFWLKYTKFGVLFAETTKIIQSIVDAKEIQLKNNNKNLSKLVRYEEIFQMEFHNKIMAFIFSNGITPLHILQLPTKMKPY